jgi:hypothetical protein
MTATPLASRSKAMLIAIATTAATRTAGTFGITLASTRIKASDRAPTASAAGRVSPENRAWTKATTSPMKPSASTEKPNSLGNCPTMIVRARPFMYPRIVGCESRSATKPSFPAPATTMMTPVMIASADASSTARAGSPPAPASGRIVAAIMGPRDESGPRTRMRDGPTRAYPRRHRIDVYRPVTAGSPASSAYAMPCGTSKADRTTPATTSLGTARAG